jgi:predicted alpha/beta-fold hydrolase
MSDPVSTPSGPPGLAPNGTPVRFDGAAERLQRHRFEPTESFRPARYLESPHAQTLFAALLRSVKAPWLLRERWDTPDGDFVDIDFLPARPEAPHLLILHGLEGSAKASYVAELLRGAQHRGWGAAALNFRCCSGEQNRLARFYHSGETDDPLFVASRLRSRISGPLFGVGFSLGGNVLLALLARTGQGAPLDAAAAISVPYDLAACARALDSGTGLYRLYRRWFLRSLRRKALLKLRKHPGIFDARRVGAARSIEAFDGVVTAPLHGFRDAADYYAQSSSGPLLGQIRRPTLLINAKDDPLAVSPLPDGVADNPSLAAIQPDHGGHVAFVAGSILRPRYWAERTALEFFATLR